MEKEEKERRRRMKRLPAILLGLSLLNPLVWATDKKANPKDANKKEEAKASYLKKTEQELDNWAAKIDALQVRISTAGANARTKIDEEFDDLRSKLQDARQKLTNLKSSTQNDWENFRMQTNQAIHDVKKAYSNTKTDVKKKEQEKKKEKK